MCDMLSSLRQGRLDELTTANFPILSTSSRTRNVVCDHASFRGEARSREFRCLEEYVSYFKDHCLRMAAEKGAKICVEIEEVSVTVGFSGRSSPTSTRTEASRPTWACC
ncbi:hypothetical protein [uncultured Oscillibacter sp.]|uniref:hypothetical protein n=1 Tax=uncultured Oscillibacter sp. TaxID=876091 RepID=UPI0026303BCB|nr:hypothetical protein [uncultured Oscillibacter sp.]